MSTLPNGFSPSPDDSRLELAMAAARAERRNRPRLILVLAVIVLLAAVINLIWTLAARSSAAANLSGANASLANIEGVVDQLDAMAEQRSDPKYDPDPDMVGKLQRFAAQVGLPRPEVAAKDPTSTGTVKGFRKRVYTTIIPEADPALLLRWVAESTDGKNFPGLEIDQLKLTPGRTLESGKVAWTLDIAFRRWERQP